VADQLRRIVVWRRLDGLGIEHCSLAQDRSGWHIHGTVIRAEGYPLLVRYAVTCDAIWQTRTVEIAVERGTDTRTLRMTVGEDRRWWSEGTELLAFRGCVDVDLGITPATNILPIRRLNLAIGETQAVTAAWVQFPTLSTEALPQRYTRLDALRYHYESADGAFTTEIMVDELGLATQYVGGWERIAATGETTGD